MQVPIAKVEIIGPKPDFPDVVAALHELGSLHIEDFDKESADKKLVRLDHSNHHLFWDYDREQVNAEILQFINKHR